MKSQEKEKSQKKQAGSFLRDMLSGTIMTDRIILNNLSFLFLLTLLAAVYIANRFHAEKITRQAERLNREIRELRAESMASSAELNNITRQSEIYRLVSQKELGIEELREPPYKLRVRGR
ncbi:MAG TPA: FtsL-like putative cell division protein [Bacteroidales bacterium]|nr:FtsL-like putative cell division protein [Bacteroidales bacterium]HRR92416.1 FtsL-like putative cell division protein [Bacteroidales bacterium]HRT90228.1 FtsL-like putative cell division protein [Bacteroidales bacterium]